MKYYLFAILPNINNALILLTIILSVPIFVGIIMYGISINENDKETSEFIKKVAKRIIPFYLMVSLLDIFLPSQKQAAFIISAPYILENKDLRDSAKNATEIIKIGTEYLKEALGDKK